MKKEKETKTEEQPAANPQQNLPALIVHTQYIKDLSLEIPLAPEIFRGVNQAPNIHVDISISNKKLDDGNFNVDLKIKLDANLGEKKFFIIELTYAAVAAVNVPAEHVEPVLYIELPRLLFPYARSIISNSLAEAGLPPMMLSPIDFVALYQAKKAKEAEMAAEK